MFTRSLIETTAGLLAAIVIVATAGCWSNRRFDEDSSSQLPGPRRPSSATEVRPAYATASLTIHTISACTMAARDRRW